MPIITHQLTITWYPQVRRFFHKIILLVFACYSSGELASVEGTPFDFLSPHTIGERYQQASDVGYDNNFCINAMPTLESDPTLKFTAKYEV